MPKGVYPRKPLKERFWEKVDVRGPDECWKWTGSKARGYGQISVGGKLVLASHVCWEVHNNSPIPEGQCVLHTCDNRACVNPRHLFLGTKADNNQDMKRKGRQARGEANGRAKLTEQDVCEIQVMLGKKIPQWVIAKKYGVDQTTISCINTGKSWDWLKEA